MFKLGISGGIGSGKTLVCQVLANLGIPVYDADTEARRLMEGDPELRKAIVRLLGQQAYRDQKLDRPWVAGQVFGNRGLLDQLNSLVHPVVGRDFLRWAELQEQAPYVVEEAALLFESGAFRHMDMNVLVMAPEELRTARVMRRDGISEEDVKQRMRMQMSEASKMKLADAVINNDETQMLLPQLIALHKNILNRK
jgi:dephospho-CoA kinase